MYVDENIHKFLEEFKRINKKGYIKSVSKSFGSVGLTFEKELGKSADSLYFPDYYGIEIKCSNRFSNYPLFLFTCAFDGPTFPEINRIVEKYGWYDKDYIDKKVLFTKLNCSKKVIINDKYKFSFELDEVERKGYLLVYDLHDNLLERESFVYFDSMYNHLCLKLNILAYVNAIKKTINKIDYFRYYDVTIFKLKGFDTFLNLLKNGVIDIGLIARIGKSGNDKGRYRNKNLVFQISKKNINLLFDKVYSANNDVNYNFTPFK